MEYVEIQIEGLDTSKAEQVTAALLGIGFESFVEEQGHFCAYIDSAAFDEGKTEDALRHLFPDHAVQFSSKHVEQKNWNEEWERNYQPVLIGGKCLIRAPFHPSMPGVPYDLVIEPKMSFGTAHHETTALLIQWLLDEPAAGKHVLDMGCGTGVLAILAAKMGAKEVRAIDSDDWAFVNAEENVVRNNVRQVHVIHGSDLSIPSGPYDIILANINRNVLLDQIPVYARVMGTGGALYMSGFYKEDLDAVREKASQHGFQFESSREQNNWMAMKCIK